MHEGRLGVRVEADLLRQFDLACRVERRSRSDGIRDAMAAYVQRVAESQANGNDAPAEAYFEGTGASVNAVTKEAIG